MTAAGADRRATHLRLKSVLEALGDADLRAVRNPSAEVRNGWGTSQDGTVDGTPVFVKVIPVTDRELARAPGTRNLFQLPTYYSYGVGSAGFGAFRELATHQKTTRWVLEGDIDSFPLLHHARLMPRLEPPPRPRVELDEYVRRWNNSRALASYMQARAAAKSELWLVLEHFPHTAASWLRDNQGAVHDVIAQLCRTIAFLRSHGIVHFDAHLHNVVGDGRHLYLTDFGLVLDREFELSAPERAFLARHDHYDYGEAIAMTATLVMGAFGELDAEEKERMTRRFSLHSIPRHQIFGILLAHLEDLHAGGDLRLDEKYIEAVVRYRPVTLYMHNFMATLQHDPRKRARYDDNQLRQLLEAVGAPLVHVADP